MDFFGISRRSQQKRKMKQLKLRKRIEKRKSESYIESKTVSAKKTFNVVLFCKLIRELKNLRINLPSASQTAI